MSSVAALMAPPVLLSRLDWLADSLGRRTKGGATMPSHQLPSDDYILAMITVLTVVSSVGMTLFSTLKNKTRKEVLAACGVSLRKVARSVREIQRKGFHIAGLLVPLVQLVLLRRGWTNGDCSRICWTITIVGTSMDFARLHVGFIARNWPMRSILREHEHKQLTGGCYFSLGCTLAICE